MNPATHNASDTRLYFLDWVRILAFFLLIAYHVGMYYVTWDWHVKSPHASDAIEPLMMLSSPWRLSLLFLISGVASSFMLTRISAGKFMRSRSVRLLVPLIFGMFVIVPPQAYFEVVEKVAYQGSYWEFMKLYVTSYHGFCRGADCLSMPTWNHLWFVAYLWVYTLLLGTIAIALGQRFDKLAQRLSSLLAGWKLLILPIALLAIIRMALAARFPTTHNLVYDWHNHAISLSMFLLGAMLARERGVWARMDALRWTALGGALACWATLVIFFSLPEKLIYDPIHNDWRVLMRVVYAACTWCAIVAVCGFAYRHLNFDSPTRRYLATAVFPVYILHQSLIVSIAHLIKPANIAPATEGPMLIVVTLCISFAAVEVLRRCRPLQPLFGIDFRAASKAQAIKLAETAPQAA